jgi:ABC-2 type transport system permease protein
MSAANAVLLLLLFNLSFLAVLFAFVAYMAKSKPVAFAVLKRNFLGYFSSPTGYVFLCLFVLLTSMAAFWPHEFFSSNMGTLSQLNYWFPIIMMFFIPAITMSIWADERRQGTDELLLTLPADDFDIVIGKYLSAASIYTASLLFAEISTFTVLCFLTLGDLDTGLFCVNYLGYWFIGLMMLAIGMVASFLTNNLTVGFILGALFNAPLAFASMADVIIPERWLARLVNSWSIRGQFDSFGRGVIAASSIAFFALVAVLGLYLCMVLIGKRNWSGGKQGNTMFLHYLTRVLCLGLAVIGISYFFRNKDFRTDATEGQVSSLSPVTASLVKQLDPKRPIVVDAFISADVPELYARTKYDLVSLLKEFESVAKRSGVPIEVNINDGLEVFSEEAKLAEQRYGIVPQTVRVRERGAFTDQQVILGAAFRSGLEKVVIPFFEYGVPVEYEVVRSLRTVAMPQRKRLGIVKNDAQFTGGFSMSNMRQVPRQPIVEELAKQYEVKEADLNAPLLADQFDVLMVVQPSLLSPQEMSNLVAAVKSGIPTAIFEDPFPFGFNFPGTGEPKQAPGGPFGGGGGMMPKGDIKELLKTLSIEMPGKPGAGGMLSPDVVWQQYNPYPKLQQMQAASDEWIFVREESPGGKDSFGPDSEISKELREVMLMYAGAIQPVKSDEFKITNLLSTGTQAGTIPYQELNTLVQSGQMSPNRIRQLQGPPTGRSVMAVQIEGTRPVAAPAAEKPADPAKAAEEKKEGDAKSGETKTENKERPIRAVFVADTDCMNPIFIEIRSRPEQFEDVDFRFQNVSFILNVIDVLSGEESYPAIRRHEPQHSTLRLLELESEDARGKEMDKRREFQKSYDDAIQEAEAENTKNIQRFEERVKKLQQEGAIDRSKFAELQEAMTQMEIERQKLQRKLGVKKEQLERVRDSQIQASQRDADLQILKIQNRYKMFAIFLPPIPPLLVGIGVFVSRRLREREGIPKSRLK